MEDHEQQSSGSKYTKINRRIRLKHPQERKDSMPDTEALHSLPSQITQQDEGSAYPQRIEVLDAARRAERRVGTATPDLADSGRI